MKEGQPSWLSVSPLPMCQLLMLSRFVTAYHIYHYRALESACLRELLGLYLLYLLTWHRIAKLPTVKSGVQSPKDGGARASVLGGLLTVVGDRRLGA